jgi:HEAT repeat protein/diketogulonate reductase-like aldo/keto reductase
MMTSDPSELLSESRRDRTRAIRELPVTEALPYALRRLLFTDLDAHVRAAAARRLGALAAPATEPWLLDALDDRSPMVRDAILRALAQCGTAASVMALRGLVEHDKMWWIRRGAIYALAAVAGVAEIPAFTRALSDPFWRVRHAAVRVLVVLGVRDPDVRDEVLDAPPSSTLTYLRSSWGPAALEAPTRARAPSALPPALLDPDPAVVTARLAGDPDVTPLALVELLCDPHLPLRILASQRLVASGDLDAIEAALDWLEQPRIPHVADTVRYLLDHLGDPAAELARRALARLDRPGAACWAIEWIVSTRSESLYDAARERARTGDAALRRAALTLVESDELATWVDDTTIDAIAAELHDRRALDVLARLDGSGHPRVRTLQLDALARVHRADPAAPAWLDVDAGLADPHHGPRAIAARWLVRAGRVDPAVLARDPDPAVREAALTPATAALAVHDPDPWVCRAAMRMLLATHREAGELPPAVLDATCSAAGAFDPWLRQQACRMPLADPRVLATVVGRLDDRDEMVRSAAHDALEHLRESDTQVRAILDGDLPAPTRAMAYSWLVRRLDDAATELARAAYDREPDAHVRALLAAVAGIELPIASRPVREPLAVERELVERVMPATERRAFGRAGFTVAPLAISGAYDLPCRALESAHAAGVDLYFWEPGYDQLTRFLRTQRDRTHIITGTYHGDPASIRLDVERALRTLRREILDVFLLFWTRSSARLDAESFAVLDALRREGKLRAIGFSTHDREIARGAIETTPWDVVMIRHSAAHPGIETAVLPTARETNTAIVTFSALTYGRMLSGPNAPTPAECYRYSLAQPGVTACISAPRRHRELAANLEALAHPSLPAERITAMREHGAGVRAESTRFNKLLRQPTRDAAAAAREMLASEPAPTENQSLPRRLPAAGDLRRSRTNRGGARRR